MQNMKLFNKCMKLKTLGIVPIAVKVDCVMFEVRDEKVLIDNWTIGNTLGTQKIEYNKTAWGSKLSIVQNGLYEFAKHDVNTVTFESEKYYKTSSQFEKDTKKFITENNNVLIVGKHAGTGKSTCAKKYDSNILFSTSYNVLCQSAKSENFKAVTLNKLLAMDFGGYGKMKEMDVSEIKTICFDEIFLCPPTTLYKMARYMKKHPEIKFIATGDANQVEPIGFRGKGDALKTLINLMFPNQIYLTVNKRMTLDSDRNKLDEMKKDIFKTKQKDMLEMLVSKYGFKTISKKDEIKTTTNISFFNSRRAVSISQHVHYNVLNHTTMWVVGQDVVCKEFFKYGKDTKVCSNYKYNIESVIDGKYKLVDVVENKCIIVTEAQLNAYFKLPYCVTVDSIQGTSLEGDYTIFDLGTPFVNAKYVYTMLTRCRRFDQVTLFRHSADDLSCTMSLKYFSDKCIGYKGQDDKANRTYDASKFVTGQWFLTELEKNDYSCTKCGNKFSMENNKSDITADRIDNSGPHHMDNCQLACLHCNHSTAKH